MAIHSTRECSIAELRPELGAAVKQYLSSDDKTLICCETESKPDPLSQVLTMATAMSAYHTSYTAQVITQNRIIYAHWEKPPLGMLGMLSGQGNNPLSVSSMRLADIVGIREQASYGGGLNVVVQGHGDTSISAFFESRQASLKFTNILKNGVEQTKAITAQPQPPKSPEDRLRALNQLHKDGLISDAEFQQKRKEILGQL